MAVGGSNEQKQPREAWGLLNGPWASSGASSTKDQKRESGRSDGTRWLHQANRSGLGAHV